MLVNFFLFVCVWIIAKVILLSIDQIQQLLNLFYSYFDKQPKTTDQNRDKKALPCTHGSFSSSSQSFSFECFEFITQILTRLSSKISMG